MAMSRVVTVVLLLLMLVVASFATSPDPATVPGKKHLRPRRPLRATRNLRHAANDDIDIPGLDTGLGRGVDVLTGDVRAPIVTFHYSYGNRWTNPYNQKTYLVPDELEIANTPGSYYEKTNHIIQNMTAYQELQKSWHHLSVGIPFIFAFQNNKETGVMKEFLRNNDTTVYLADTTFSFYEMEMWPYSILDNQENSRLTKMIATLPAHRGTAAEKDQYKRFIQTFGTHFNTQCKFGGEVMFLIAVENSLFYTKSVDWVYHQASLSFQLSYVQFGFNSEHNSENVQVDSLFLKHSKSLTIVKGGNDNLAKNYTQQWFASTIDNPAQIRPTLVEISTLIKDPVKSALMHDAIMEYLSTPQPSMSAARSLKSAANTAADIPGVNSGIARGYDVVTETIRNPVVMYHYDYQQTWNNPYVNNELNIYPDELFLTNTPFNIIDSEVNMLNSWQSYSHMEESYINAHIGLGLGNGINIDAAFGGSKKRVEQWLKNNTCNIGIENRIIALYMLEMWPDFDLHPRLKSMIDHLPTTYQSEYDKEQYGKLINMFGTHYVSAAVLGSFINFTTVFDSSLYDKYTASWVSHQVSLSLEWNKFKIGIDTGKNSSTEKVDHVFSEHSSNYKDSEGGNPIILESKGYADWVLTVPTNPAMLLKYKCVMYPLHYLISNNPTKKTNMLLALQNYVKTGVLPGN